MGRFSPTVTPERGYGVGDFADDAGEALLRFSAARRLKKGGELEEKKFEQTKKYQDENLELEKAQRALEQARWEQQQAQGQARLGTQGIVPEEQSGTRAPVMFGGRKTVVPDLGVGIGQQDVTKFTPNPGSFNVGGGYAYDPGRDVNRIEQRDTADRTLALKQQEQARQRAALIARGYSEADADLVVQGGVGAEKIGPLAAEGEERDIKRYKATVLARELQEQAGANWRDVHGPNAGNKVNAEGLTPYQAAQLERQDAQYREQRDANDLKLADEIWKPDPLGLNLQTPADSAAKVKSDSVRSAVTERRGRVGPGYNPLFPSRQPADSAPGRFAPKQAGPVGQGRYAGPENSAPPQAAAPTAKGPKPPARERAEFLRSKGYNKDQIRLQLEHEGYALK